MKPIKIGDILLRQHTRDRLVIVECVDISVVNFAKNPQWKIPDNFKIKNRGKRDRFLMFNFLNIASIAKEDSNWDILWCEISRNREGEIINPKDLILYSNYPYKSKRFFELLTK